MLVQKPWGSFRILEEAETHKVKRLVVEPRKRLSLQMHEYRSEYWIVVKGIGKATVDDTEILLEVGDIVCIPRKAKHRLENLSDGENVEIIEVQTGTHFSEDDIYRFEDDFGRIETKRSETP